MRPAVPVAAVLALLALSLPARADLAGQEAACIGAASQQLGIAAFDIRVVDVAQTLEGSVVTLGLPGQFATCIVSDADEVLEVTSGDGRATDLTEDWQEECINIAATMQGVPPTSVALGENIAGLVDLLVLGGVPMVCHVDTDGSVQSVNYR